MRQRLFRFSLTLALGSASCLLASGFAQTPSSESPVELPSWQILEQRIAEASPGAQMTMWSGAAIAESGISEVTALMARTPNFHAGSGGLRSFGDILQMRGIGNTPYFSSPGVLVSVDGAMAGDTFANGLWSGEIDRIEIFRGPQPTLFGRNAPAGVINIILRQPDDHPTARASVSYGRFAAFTAQASVQSPVLDSTLFAGASFRYAREDGFIHNSTLGRPVDDRELSAGQVQFRWLPTPNWEISLLASLQKTDDGSQRITQFAQAWNTEASDLPGESLSQRDSELLKVVHHGEELRLTLLTSRHGWNLDPLVIDYDFSPAPAVASRLWQTQDQWSQEIRLESTVGERPWNWKLGGLFYDASTQGAFYRTVAYPRPDGSILNSFVDTQHSLEEETLAFYGQLNYNLSSSWQASASLRWDQVKKSLQRSTVSTSTSWQSVAEQRQDSEYSPALGLVWKPSGQFQLFTRYVQTFQPGGYSAYTSNATLRVFREATIRAWEAGGTWEIVPAKWRIETTAFWYRFTDYQVERSFTPIDYVVVNAPRAESRGVEVEMIARPFRSLELSAGWGLLDATFERYRDPITNADFAGKKLPYAPAFTWSLAAAYAVPEGPLAGLKARLAYRLLGPTYFSEANAAPFFDGGYGLLEARLSYTWQAWEIALYGKNLSDDRHYEFILPELYGGIPGQPRSYGVSVEWKY